VQAAREALARTVQSNPRADGPREGLRVLLLARDTAVSARTAAIKTLKAPAALGTCLRAKTETPLTQTKRPYLDPKPVILRI
jgi:hypothetical protein